jgi:diketogulonate reductase-like aldo/keto reductase
MAQPAIGAQASRLAKDLTLNGPAAASRIPKLIYGTAWKKDRTEDLVHRALQAGFRAVDTAAQPKHYDEQAVGAGVRRAVADSVISREDLFVSLSCLSQLCSR